MLNLALPVRGNRASGRGLGLRARRLEDELGKMQLEPGFWV